MGSFYVAAFVAVLSAFFAGLGVWELTGDVNASLAVGAAVWLGWCAVSIRLTAE